LKPIDLTLSAVFAVLTSLGAWIFLPIPFSPVPVTLQSLFVVLSGASLGSKRGALSQIIYLLIGLVGFPVFSRGNSGPGVFVGPTGGYLVGFVLGAYVTGRLVETRPTPSLIWAFASTLSGVGVIYVTGVGQLWFWLRGSLTSVLLAGVIPFLPGDVVKAAVAAYISTRNQVKAILSKSEQHNLSSGHRSEDS